ncbi:flagellar basal body rod protein FlgC [Clostridiales bacterium COT073_COT-073]|nr:flagellar basal body rod protein FlgC [Clostridiales bacterium COT073_COT-073]
MAYFDILKISSSGMTAQRLRADIIAQNLANVKTTRAANGKTYRRQTVLFETLDRRPNFKDILAGYTNGRANGGVKVSRVVEDQSPLTTVYEPNHPDANEEGYVSYPNVNVVQEMTDLISAHRSLEANITAFNATKAMIAKAMEIGK